MRPSTPGDAPEKLTKRDDRYLKDPSMKLSDLIPDERIAAPMEVTDLGEALRTLLSRLGDAALGAAEAERLAAELAAGRAGELIRVNADVIVVVTRLEAPEELSAALGVAARAFRVALEEASGTARALLLLVAPRGLRALDPEVVRTLVRVLGGKACTRRLLAAGSVAEVRALKELMETDLREGYLVGDALAPVRYRVYADTPLSEVVDLIVRRDLHAVPVVGEHYELMGLLTVGDALRALLPPQAAGRAARSTMEQRARDVMTRSVLCVSEDQSLNEAASIIVNRGVEQLPVARDGELVGFLTRAAVLRLLFKGPEEGG